MFVSAGVIFLIIFWIMMILASYAMLAMELVGLWKTFRKMGHPGWKGIIPFYGTYVLFRDLWKTKYFWLIVILSGASVAVMLLMYAVMAIVMVATRGENPEAVLIIISVLMLVLELAIAVVAIVYEYKLMKRLALAFGKSTGFAVGLTFLFPIFVLILGVDKSVYLGRQICD